MLHHQRPRRLRSAAAIGEESQRSKARKGGRPLGKAKKERTELTASRIAACRFLFRVLSPGNAAPPGRIESVQGREDRTTRMVCPGKVAETHQELADDLAAREAEGLLEQPDPFGLRQRVVGVEPRRERSEEHTSELQSLMRISYAVFC